MACDICKNNTKSLVDLREIYQTNNGKVFEPTTETT